MTPSTLAVVALLTAPLGAITNAQHVANGGAATQYKRVKTIRGSPSPRARLHASDPDESELLATCSAFPSQGNCDSSDSCAWCVSGAVASACYPAVMTSRLPAGVFQCSNGKRTGAKVAAEEAAAPVVESGAIPEETQANRKASQTFNLKEGVTHTLNTGEVDKDFCDASSPLSLAGYMNVAGSTFDTKNDKNLFYWFFEKRTISQVPGASPKLESGDKEIPLVIWLTGGPGCSSSLALLSENGPCSVESDGATTKVNPYSWTESANVLWLDQPADVGYSYGQGNDSNEEMISEDAYYFLQAWLKSDEGQKYKDAPLFIVGESYGGHYAPAIAHRIWRGNKDLLDGLATLKLRGLGVGNGLTDPEEQYKWYAEMAYKNSHNIEVISETVYDEMTAATPACTMAIHQCNNNKGDGMLDPFACQAAFSSCNLALVTPYSDTKKNPYDITKNCGSNPLCYDFSRIEKFMNSDTTKRALHVDEHNPSWKTCNMLLNLKFHVDWMKNFAPYVADLLNDGIPALIYAGDLDFICNYKGNHAWTLNLDWNYHDQFKAANEHDWNSGAGLARTSNGLTFLQVYDAGHMVPSDQPEHSLDMITQFLNGDEF